LELELEFQSVFASVFLNQSCHHQSSN